MCLAVPGRVISLSNDDGVAKVGRIDFGGTIKDASMAFLPDVVVGQYVLVHAGVAISVLSEADAEQTFSHLDEIGVTECTT